MLLAAGATESSIGGVVIALSVLVPVAVGLLSLFVLRREVESKSADHDRRITHLEERDPPTASTFLDHSRRNADQHQHMERQLATAQAQARAELTDIAAKLHEKISAVDRNVTAVEVETRVQSKTLDAIAKKLDVHS